MEKEQFEKLMSRLDTITKLLAANLPLEMTLNEKAMLLTSLGLTSTEVAAVLGTTATYVRVAVHRTKKTKAKGRKNRKGRNAE